MTSTSDVKKHSVTLVMKDAIVQGGGTMHLINLLVNAGNFSVDDLGVVSGDAYDNR